MSCGTGRRVLGGIGLAAVLCAAPAVASDASPSGMDKVTDGQLAEATSALKLDGATTTFDLTGATSPVAVKSVEGAVTKTTLASDILFDFAKASIAPGARVAIEKAVETAPKGQHVTVDGYTDSIADTSSNVRLSEQRAKAVADVIRAKRPDLDVATEGRGEASPVAPNSTGGKDDPAGRAKNRRVEIRFESS